MTETTTKKCDDVCSCTCVCVCSSRESSQCVLASTNVFKFESVLTVGHHAYVACFFYDAKEKKKRDAKQQQQEEHHRWLLSIIDAMNSLLLTRASIHRSIPPPSLIPEQHRPPPPLTPDSLPQKPPFLSLTEAELDGIRHTELNTMVLVEHGVSYICLRRTIQPVIFVPRSQ